ncbi:MAG TPA: 2-succinyl-5-enolpyruvyl-6-hydroxy-3-cyclohexene-1-carboxylic-acid synthase [Acidimicrobiales bacterium]|nr:2-succinyl-5-enolpyruvyl-6-hydroxy-3-cyclohexene-1-carboxylic-acid synthase [Acidimicrobiales bacterium]
MNDQPVQRSGTQPVQRSGTQPADIQAAFCAVLVDEWVRAGVTDAVVAPGSRSTPLVIALDDAPSMRVHVVLDERSAGFVALGIGLSTRRPAVVVTTSGTAAVELHPAVVEAHQAGVPLIAVTSDRPSELHHVGAPQTVEQEGLFGPVVRFAMSLGVADLGAVASWRSVASRMVAEALAGPSGPGPVHANLAFREPLIGDPASVAVPAGRAGSAPWHTVFPLDRPEQTPPDIAALLGSHAGGRGLVLAGAGCGPAEDLLDAAAALGWPVLADPRSGCRAGASSGAVASADSLLRVPPIASGWIPDVVVRAGAPWASKVLSQWIASLPPEVPQVLCDPWGRRLDPERAASAVVGSDGAAALLRAAAASASGSAAGSSWRRNWLDADACAQRVFDALLGAGGELELSEPAVARALAGSCQPGTRLVVSSSMPVRDVEWFGPPAQPAEVLSNRGANGIDGVVSTSVGVAVAEPRPVAALLGDLAFLYDAGALLWAGRRDLSLTVVVVDNAGGGIFSFLPQATAVPPDRFERYWGTPHGVDLAAVAGAYGVQASRVDSRVDLDRVVSTVGKPGVSVAVVRSDRGSNVEAHDRLNAAVASALEADGSVS